MCLFLFGPRRAPTSWPQVTDLTGISSQFVTAESLARVCDCLVGANIGANSSGLRFHWEGTCLKTVQNEWSRCCTGCTESPSESSDRQSQASGCESRFTVVFLAKGSFSLSIVATQRSCCLHELDGGFYLVGGRCGHAHRRYETPVGPLDALYNLVDFPQRRISCVV
jgi:hypothetical protein